MRRLRDVIGRKGPDLWANNIFIYTYILNYFYAYLTHFFWFHLQMVFIRIIPLFNGFIIFEKICPCGIYTYHIKYPKVATLDPSTTYNECLL